MAAVRDGVETVAGAQDFYFLLGLDDRPDLLWRGGFFELSGAVGEVPRPVGHVSEIYQTSVTDRPNGSRQALFTMRPG